ncbi:MAG: MBL fold metallo-hydrolase [Proteobacteria bacterium]|nr:MBL fold metallo-hydrolase [Pseudomonadota bacterium]
MTVNRAYDRPAATVHPRLTEHSKKMEQKVYRVAEGYYLAVGYGIANTHMIVGDDGVIIIDPVEDVVKCRRIREDFRRIADKPVKAVIYTHNHADHVWGVKGFVSEEEVKAGRCQIIAHETMLDNFIVTATGGIGVILGIRSNYSFGSYLELGPGGRINNGIGPDILIQETSFIVPTLTVKDRLDLEVAGVRMEIIWVPSECDDEIAVWFPDLKVLCSAEVIQGETFPNLHTIRGTRYRDPRQWYKSIDVLRRYPAECMAPSHGRPVYGSDEVADVLTAYRDAIQFVHNQTIRYMNQGCTPDDLAGMVALPEHLADHPWLGEFYGTVKHSVREIYQGEIGWFEGDPTTLDPTPSVESAARHVELMGGRDRVTGEARRALESEDYQWAAELATYVIRVNREDLEAREIKAAALRQLGFQTLNTNWRCWYLTSALELEGVPFDYSQAIQATDVVRALPAAVKVEAMCLRLAAEKALDVRLTMGFHFPDLGESYALEIRRGVAEFHPEPPERTDVSVTMDDRYLADIILGLASYEEGIQTGRIQVQGDLNDLVRFFGCFDRPRSAREIALTLR